MTIILNMGTEDLTKDQAVRTEDQVFGLYGEIKGVD